MARRRKSGDGGQSFDSLLDTMTNVVGILVIMLVVTLLGTREAVRRIKWEIPDITQAKLDEYKKLADLKKEQLSDALADVKEVQEVLAKLAELEKEIEALKASLDMKSLAEQIADYKKKIAELEKELEKLKSDDLAKELAKVKHNLEQLPKKSKKASKVIRMPSPRSPDPGSTCVWFVCQHNCIAQLEQEELMETALKRINSSKYLLAVREKGKVKKVSADEKTRHSILREVANWVLDPEKLKEYFDQKNIGDRDFRLSIELHPSLNTERLYATMRKEAGEGPKEIGRTNARFRSVVRGIDKRKQYARFIVAPDSFEVYVKAREIVEHEDIPAGWLVHTGDSWQIGYDFGLHVDNEKKPAPKPAGGGNKPSKPTAPVHILD